MKWGYLTRFSRCRIIRRLEVHDPIITTTPKSLVGKIHDRMPVILDPEDEAMWLDADIVEPERLLPLLKQYPAEKMEEWRVGDEARNPKNDYPELIKPL